MMLKLKMVAAAVLAVVSASSFAVADNLGTIGTAGVGDFFATGMPFFSDTFTFTLASASTLTGVTGESGISSFTAILLSSSPVATVGFDTTPASFSFAGLAAGTYTLQFIGFSAAPGAFYGGTISAAPVPEPETYALMLAGLGAMGFMAVRRKSRS